MTEIGHCNPGELHQAYQTPKESSSVSNIKKENKTFFVLSFKYCNESIARYITTSIECLGSYLPTSLLVKNNYLETTMLMQMDGTMKSVA